MFQQKEENSEESDYCPSGIWDMDLASMSNCNWCVRGRHLFVGTTLFVRSRWRYTRCYCRSDGRHHHNRSDFLAYRYSINSHRYQKIVRAKTITSGESAETGTEVQLMLLHYHGNFADWRSAMPSSVGKCRTRRWSGPIHARRKEK